MRSVIKILFILFASGIYIHGIAQKVDANANLDKDWILIGDQVKLEITLSCPSETNFIWPEIGDTITGQIEVIRKFPLDTIISASNPEQALYSQQVVITSFDSGYHALPPFIILYKFVGDDEFKAIETEALLLEVSTLDVDMEKDIMDISPLIDVPVSFSEIFPWLLGGLAFIMLLVLLILYLRKRKKAEPLIQIRKKPHIPPHLIALDALQSLKLKKLWQTGRIKDYHTELTDIVRTYISDKFKIHAAEMVTYEIMDEIDQTPVSGETRKKLKEMLEMADMVKFAKGHPLPDEEERSMNYAIDFVKDTISLIEEDTNKTTTNV